VAGTVVRRSEIARVCRSTSRMLLRALEEADSSEFVRVAEGSRSEWAPWTPAPEAGQTPHERWEDHVMFAITKGDRDGDG